MEDLESQLKAQKEDADADTVKTTQLSKDVKENSQNLGSLESRVVSIASVVANMTECASNGEHHAGNGVCEPEQTWSCPALKVDGEGQASISEEAFIGTRTKITCLDQWWLDGEPELECIGASGDESATGAHWGLASSGDAHLPACKKCKDECATCSDGDTCITCKKGSQIFSPVDNACIENKARSCKELLDWGELEMPASPKTSHTVKALLYPDVAKSPDRRVTAYCHVTVEQATVGGGTGEGTGGGGGGGNGGGNHTGKDGEGAPPPKVSAFTSILCSELEGTDQFASSPCKKVRTIDDASSCDADGYVIPSSGLRGTWFCSYWL